jgi:hypothetical protein
MCRTSQHVHSQSKRVRSHAWLIHVCKAFVLFTLSAHPPERPHRNSSRNARPGGQPPPPAASPRPRPSQDSPPPPRSTPRSPPGSAPSASSRQRRSTCARADALGAWRPPSSHDLAAEKSSSGSARGTALLREKDRSLRVMRCVHAGCLSRVAGRQARSAGRAACQTPCPASTPSSPATREALHLAGASPQGRRRAGAAALAAAAPAVAGAAAGRGRARAAQQRGSLGHVIEQAVQGQGGATRPLGGLRQTQRRRQGARAGHPLGLAGGARRGASGRGLAGCRLCAAARAGLAVRRGALSRAPARLVVRAPVRACVRGRPWPCRGRRRRSHASAKRAGRGRRGAAARAPRPRVRPPALRPRPRATGPLCFQRHRSRAVYPHTLADMRGG